MPNHAVVIAGGGPTGLVLAGELALAGVDVAIVERRLDQSVAGSRAGGLHARSLELLAQRGIAERFVAEGTPMQTAGFATTQLDITDFPTRFNYGLALKQERIEHHLAAWVAELGVPVYRGREVAGFTQDAAGVEIDGIRAAYLVGCDGGRSVIRKAAGIELAGWDASVSYLIAECRMRDAPPIGMHHGERGVYGVGPLGDGRVRAVLAEPEVRHGDTPAIDELREALVRLFGRDFGVHDVTWLSRFSDATRQAVAYRAGRVLIAGDAAHVHSPAGGQGLNLGLADAMNLGWKLARVVLGTSKESLLDTYQAERHPVAARALKLTMAQTAVNRGDPRTTALREITGELLAVPGARAQIAATLTGLDIRYDLGGAHPLVGRRMPDLDLETADGTVRVSSLLHAASPVLLDFGSSPACGLRRVAARPAGPWVLPVVGPVPAPAAVLIRPDGYVAWVGARLREIDVELALHGRA